MSTYKHAEAFCLMRYESRDGRTVEMLWNSRDGVTPFGIHARDGKTDLFHTMRHMDRRPLHVPQIGDRIFISLTKEKAREYAEMQAKAFSEMWNEHYPTDQAKSEALASIAENNYHEGHAPDLYVVDSAFLNQLAASRSGR